MRSGRLGAAAPHDAAATLHNSVLGPADETRLHENHGHGQDVRFAQPLAVFGAAEYEDRGPPKRKRETGAGGMASMVGGSGGWWWGTFALLGHPAHTGSGAAGARHEESRALAGSRAVLLTRDAPARSERGHASYGMVEGEAAASWLTVQAEALAVAGAGGPET